MRRDYFGVRNRGSRCVVNRANKTRGLSFAIMCAEKMSKAAAAAVSLPFKLCPPSGGCVPDWRASAAARSVELYSVLTCKAKKQVSPYLFAERKASGTGARVKPFRELRWRDVVLRRNARDYYAAGRTGRRMRQPSTAAPSAKPPSALSRRTLTCHTRM